ncbi:hypothetical protein SAMN04489712_105451 [Thermomonospora echinospora]|uniref:Guanylate cyclase domain-containing protein n=2 Tax=Thermomonospora echinospora TaxID=1992 RepID=A0A1H6AHX7_9ACTN|nr:hypothetical protein SAMN04489712_105451 [Thermomonospora echinospora]
MNTAPPPAFGDPPPPDLTQHAAVLRPPARQWPVHCGMIALDITGFARRADPHLQLHLRQALYRITHEACRSAGLDWDACHREDRGDGLLLIAPPAAGVHILLHPLVGHLLAGLRAHNKVAGRSARLRLRMAVHAGFVYADPYGVTGTAVNHLFRLLEAPAFKAAATGDLALIVSGYLYEEAAVHRLGLPGPDRLTPLTITSKETRTVAWTWQPTGPRPDRLARALQQDGRPPRRQRRQRR